MKAFRDVVLERARDAAAVAAALLATGMLRVAPLFEGRPYAAWLATVAEQFATWLLLCLAIVAAIAACERWGGGGRRRVVLQVVGKRIQLSKGSSWAPGEEPASRVVMLALGHESQFGAVAADLGRCLDNSTSPPNRFVEAVVNILRGPSDPSEADVPPR